MVLSSKAQFLHWGGMSFDDLHYRRDAGEPARCMSEHVEFANGGFHTKHENMRGPVCKERRTSFQNIWLDSFGTADGCRRRWFTFLFAYAQSKVANTMFAAELARRYAMPVLSLRRPRTPEMAASSNWDVIRPKLVSPHGLHPKSPS